MHVQFEEYQSIDNLVEIGCCTSLLLAGQLDIQMIKMWNKMLLRSICEDRSKTVNDQ